jgi:hypothetical protein
MKGAVRSSSCLMAATRACSAYSSMRTWHRDRQSISAGGRQDKAEPMADRADGTIDGASVHAIRW